MAHGLQQQSVLKQQQRTKGDNNNNKAASKTGIGSRRIFPPHFKLQVLDSYRNDSDCKGNQRATARKYGIHRRQIQKWLQAETNLRNSVTNNNNQTASNNNNKGANNTTTTSTSNNAASTLIVGCDLSLSGCCRLRDDTAPDAYYNEQLPRVPCIGGVPEAYEHCCASPQLTSSSAAALDYSSSSSSSSSLCDMPLSSSTSTLNLPSPSLSPSQYNNKSPSPVMIDYPYLNSYDPTPIIHEPIDLSLKHLRAISPYTVKCLPVQPTPLYLSSIEERVDPEVWDLSVRKRAFKQEQVEMEPPAKRPVKLFKPYLDDNQDSEEVYAKPALVNNNYSPPPASTDYPPNTCCAPSSYYYQSNVPYIQGYSCLTTYNPMVLPLKQRQSYSVDFKLRAIETYYYGDECCRGNQRAVASKYNVHRRQVQKWLRQEEELRTRNVSVPDEHAQQQIMMGS